MDTVRPEDVRDLVRIGDHRGRAERQHQAGELVDEQLRRLEMHVGVDKPRHEVPAGELKDLAAVVVPDSGDVPVRDREIAVEPLAREDREHLRAADHEVGGLVSAGDGEAAAEVGHCRENVLSGRGAH